MANSEIQAAIVALLTVGVILLNLGADMITGGNVGEGLLVCAFGAALIMVSVILIKTLAEKTAKLVILEMKG